MRRLLRSRCESSTGPRGRAPQTTRPLSLPGRQSTRIARQRVCGNANANANATATATASARRRGRRGAVYFIYAAGSSFCDLAPALALALLLNNFFDTFLQSLEASRSRRRRQRPCADYVCDRIAHIASV